MSARMGEEKPLIHTIRQGDRRAFDELYQRLYLSLRGYAELLLSEEEAEDVVQDVFLNIWLNREKLDESQSIRAYLYRAVYNTSLNVIKRKMRTSDYSNTEKELEELRSNYFNPDTCDIIRTLYNRELRDVIEKAIDSLPPRCREVFVLSYLEDVPSKEISVRLGVSLSTVDNHNYTALKLLREKLSKYRSETVALLLLFVGL